ncbi:MAG: FkbM family methyltransferase [Planctomycetes bacterium]|nr:FkbM family methyltransferase [Planctomycetota bacterium]
MLRQLNNLWRYGRLRTNSSTPRKRKPKILCERPELEIGNMIDFVQAHHGKRGEDFFFVQIGAFDGVTADPIYGLVRKHGWHGVLVEPQVEAFDLLQKNYADQSGLQFFNIAIGAEDGEISLFTRTDGMVQAASLEKHLMNKPGRRRRLLQERRVPCWTFGRLLTESNAPHDIDLLQIDAEGFDYEIIRSIDFNVVKPAIIHYEHMVLSEPDRNACLELLASEGYRFVLQDNDTLAYRDASYVGEHRSSTAARAA